LIVRERAWRRERRLWHNAGVSDAPNNAAAIELTAVLVAVTAEEPRVLTIQDGKALPSGPFESEHRTLQAGLRAWVERQTHHPLGYIEQLYTFADRDRIQGGRSISISYLGLTREARASGDADPGWRSWYRHLPWEDWRGGMPAVIRDLIAPQLRRWVADSADARQRRQRAQRIDAGFGAGERNWNEEAVLQRYELLYEAGLVAEAANSRPVKVPLPGEPMMHDHRRILATGVARLRAKIKYRPVVFELMPPSFTLLELQRAVEALAGRRLHKQNFRRLIDQQRLVEETGEMSTETGGRPAKRVRFRREVLIERAAAGTKLPLSRSA
jgi:hypothetical protein